MNIHKLTEKQRDDYSKVIASIHFARQSSQSSARVHNALLSSLNAEFQAISDEIIESHNLDASKKWKVEDVDGETYVTEDDGIDREAIGANEGSDGATFVGQS